MAVYHAFPCGKMNQCIRMENESNQVIYEGNLVKFKLFTACDYEFINHVAVTTVPHKVGKVYTTEQGSFGYSANTASYFKLDGKNCFEVLEGMGYRFKLIAKLDILHPEFALIDNAGEQIAVYKMNVKGEREENVTAIGNLQRNTQITTESDNLELIFLGAFILGRVDFSLLLV